MLSAESKRGKGGGGRGGGRGRDRGTWPTRAAVRVEDPGGGRRKLLRNGVWAPGIEEVGSTWLPDVFKQHPDSKGGTTEERGGAEVPK